MGDITESLISDSVILPSLVQGDRWLAFPNHMRSDDAFLDRCAHTSLANQTLPRSPDGERSARCAAGQR